MHLLLWRHFVSSILPILKVKIFVPENFTYATPHMLPQPREVVEAWVVAWEIADCLVSLRISSLLREVAISLTVLRRNSVKTVILYYRHTDLSLTHLYYNHFL